MEKERREVNEIRESTALNPPMPGKMPIRLLITSQRGVLTIRPEGDEHDNHAADLSMDITCKLCNRCPGHRIGPIPLNCHNTSPCG